MDDIWRRCKVTNKEFNSVRGFLNHLRTIKMSSKEYYDKFHKKDNEGFCYCGKETKYHGFKYKGHCSNACINKSEEHRKKVSQRFVNNPDALENFRILRKNVVWDYTESTKKRKKTIKKKCESLGITEEQYYSEIGKKSYLNLSPIQKETAKIKRMKTILKTGNSGGRSGYKSYPFFDETLSLQGYEPLVIDSLIKDFYLCKNDIVGGKSGVPIIKYNGNRIYFPDFYLPKYNLMIEVKSIYTYNLHMQNVHDKCLACVKSGYSIVLLVLNKREARNRKLEGSKNLLHWAISSQDPNPKWYGEGSSTIP
jgi:hypothetical protein